MLTELQQTIHDIVKQYADLSCELVLLRSENQKLKQLLSKAMFPNDELQAQANEILKGKE